MNAGDGEGVAAGDAVADGDEVTGPDGVGCATPTGVGLLRSGPATTSTPTTRIAITAAATAATQYSVRAAGGAATAFRTRSRRFELGEPAISSKTWLRSRRKFSSLIGSRPPRSDRLAIASLLDRSATSRPRARRAASRPPP